MSHSAKLLMCITERDWRSTNLRLLQFLKLPELTDWSIGICRLARTGQFAKPPFCSMSVSPIALSYGNETDLRFWQPLNPLHYSNIGKYNSATPHWVKTSSSISFTAGSSKIIKLWQYSKLFCKMRSTFGRCSDCKVEAVKHLAWTSSSSGRFSICSGQSAKLCYPAIVSFGQYTRLKQLHCENWLIAVLSRLGAKRYLMYVLFSNVCSRYSLCRRIRQSFTIYLSSALQISSAVTFVLSIKKSK